VPRAERSSVARRVSAIGMSPTLAVSALAQQLRAEGRDVLDFSAGQPDFPTPDEIKQAGKRAIDENQTRYTANQGIAELRQAVVDRLETDQGLDYAPDQVIVSAGQGESLFRRAGAVRSGRRGDRSVTLLGLVPRADSTGPGTAGLR